MLGQEAAVAGDLGAVAGDDHLVEGDADLDAAADEAGVDRVVVGVDPHVVVPGQPGREPPRRVGQHRREGQHRAAVLEDRVRRPRPGGGVDPVVRSAQPAGELAVEVGDVVEAAAGQEARLEVAVGPLDEALGLGVARGAQLTPDAERAPERLELAGRGLGGPGATGRCSPPGPTPRCGARAPNWPSTCRMPPNTSWAGPGGIIQPAMQPGEARHADDHPQLVGLAEPERDLDVGLPQIPLGQLARPIARCAGTDRAARTTGAAPRTRSLQDRHPALPADPLGDHRRRHRRELAPAAPGSRGSTASTADPAARPLIRRWRVASAAPSAPCSGRPPAARRSP